MSVPNGWPPAYCGGSTCGGSSVTPISFTYGPMTDAFGRLRVSEPYTLFDSQQRYSADDTFVSNVANGGTVTFVTNQSSVVLSTTSTLNSYAARETKYVFTYQPGKSLLALTTFCMAPKATGLVQKVGYYGQSNGIFLELSDDLYIVQRSNVTGVVVDTKIPQSQWSWDVLNGYGTSGYTLDITKTHIFWTDIEWLGVGNVRTGFVINGQFLVAHVFQHANYLTTAYMTTATLPIRYEIQNTDSVPSSNLIQICSTVLSEGGYDQPYHLYSNIAVLSRTMTAGTWYPAISVRLAPGYLDAVAQVKQVDISMVSTDLLHWALWSNVSAANLTGESFVAHTSSSLVQIDQSATAMTTTGCQQIAAGLVSGTNQSAAPIMLELTKYQAQLGRDSFTNVSEIFTLAVYSVTGSSGGSSISLQALLSWNELL